MSHTPCRDESASAALSVPEPGRRGLPVFYGWIMLPIAMAGAIASSPAQTFGIAPFNPHFRAALGLSETQLTGAYMLGTLLAALPLRYVGAAMDRHGIRKTKTAVVLLFGLTCILVSQVAGLVSLFLAFLALRLLGQGALGGVLSGSTLAFWFERRLGTVEGLRNAGMAGAIAIVPGVILWLIDAVGWRWAYVVLGVAVWVAILPLMLLFRNRPEDVGQLKDGLRANSADDSSFETIANGEHDLPSASDSTARDFTPAEARRTRAFWLALLPTATWALTNTGVIFSAVPLFQARGASEADIAWLFTMFAVGFAVMIVVGGYLADRVPLNVLLSVGTACMAGSWVMVRTMDSLVMLLPIGLLLGLTQGTLVGATAPLWPRYFGRAHLGKLRGMLVTVMVASSSAGPFVMGVTRDYTGSYDPALTAFIIVCVPLSIAVLWATPPARRASAP
ncbi:MAG: MFS transporter [Phycisphaeraceae bacterium]